MAEWTKSAGTKSVDAYLAGVPPKSRATLQKVRTAIKATSPKLTEGISWRMPVYKLGTTPIVAFAAAKEHCSLFIMNAAVMVAHKADLKSYDTAKGTLRFPIGKPPPATLVRKLVKAHVADVEARKAKKRA